MADDENGFGAPVADDSSDTEGFGAPQQPQVLMPTTWTDVVKGAPEFAKQVGQAAKQNASDIWQGVKSAGSEALGQLKEDPSRIVPMWFSGMMGALGAGARTVATPVEALSHGNVSDALSSAAGGDPDKAREYAAQGNHGGEFWEMMGKPLAMIATGELIGRTGRVLEGAEIPRLRIIRSVMSKSGGLATGISDADAQLAQQAFQDAARETYGVGTSGHKALSGALPTRSGGLQSMVTGTPLTSDAVAEGNQEVLRIARRAVDLSGEIADQVNAHLGYLDGRQAAKNIQGDLLYQAQVARKNGLTSYAKALEDRAASMNGKATLGQIYEVKKAANKLSGVVRNTQESIDLMDSWSALASSIRSNIYPIYESHISSIAPNSPFSVVAAGRKEGAAMMLRNGMEKRWMEAQNATDTLQSSGKILTQAGHGLSEHRTMRAAAVRQGQKMGILPTEEGALNKDVTKAIGPLSPGTVPEHLNVTTPATFRAAAPSTQPLLPGQTFKFRIPGIATQETQEGKIAQSAQKYPKHAFESPAYQTASAPTRTPLGSEGQMGTDINTARTPAAQHDVIKGGGVLETSDLATAEDALAKMKLRMNRYIRNGATFSDQRELSNAIADLQNQVNQYKKGAAGRPKILHTPPTLTYTPRVTGELPVTHPVRKAMPAAGAGYAREKSKR